MSTAELASSYAALILADDGVEISADKLQALIKAAGLQDIEPIWTSIFAKVRRRRDQFPLDYFADSKDDFRIEGRMAR
ncbi:60S acidic ribosomal protein P1 [Claviceps maximensis]|nr:60S acidic ribosomal protein P1 [Claviceps maximensis]